MDGDFIQQGLDFIDRLMIDRVVSPKKFLARIVYIDFTINIMVHFLMSIFCYAL